jgi:hypothetical protein
VANRPQFAIANALQAAADRSEVYLVARHNRHSGHDVDAITTGARITNNKGTIKLEETG